MADTRNSKSQQSDHHASDCDLEYRASEDDAWYNVSVTLDATGETLAVKYFCSPGGYEVVFSAADFRTEAQVEELIARFRPISKQCKDYECGEVSTGSTVCAAHAVGDYDLRFYDAIVGAVDHQPHLSVDDEEQCLCTFVLFWLHGRAHDTLTSASIGSICKIVPVLEVDHRLSAFATLAKGKMASKSIPSSLSHGSESGSSHSCKVNNPLHIDQSLETQENGGMQIDTVTQSPMRESGGESCHVILVNVMEEDLTPSPIKKFIFKQTGIMPQAFVFPRMPNDPFARGAIMVNCPEKIQIIYKFLENPNHIIVSSRGRPWIVVEKPTATEAAGALQSTWRFSSTALDELNGEGTDDELKIVCPGTDAYRRANQLKDLFLDYTRHIERLCKKLVLEEKKIQQLSQQSLDGSQPEI